MDLSLPVYPANNKTTHLQTASKCSFAENNPPLGEHQPHGLTEDAMEIIKTLDTGNDQVVRIKSDCKEKEMAEKERVLDKW